MENYVVSDGTREWHLRANGLPPPWIRAILLTGGAVCARRTTKRIPRRSGPNYDGTYNSVLAAHRYAKIRSTVRSQLLRHYVTNANMWLSGRTLIDQFGTEALRRSRELRESYGWPIIERPAGKGVTWEYCMDLSTMQRVITLKRRRSAA